MSVKIAINGFGRIGRDFVRIAEQKGCDFEVVAVNNASATPQTIAHLFKYDSIFGRFPGEVYAKDSSIVINGHEIKAFNIKEPKDLPWKDLGVDIVFDSSSKYKEREKAIKHIEAGAKKVIISAPATDEDITIVMGVNDDKYNPTRDNIISTASCTTNCLAPVSYIIDKEFGIESGLMTTIHSYTQDQKILDLNHKDLRRGRAAGLSMIPTSTGAAKALGKVLPQLQGKVNGYAMRVPTPDVSVVDVAFVLSKSTTKEEVNRVLKKACETYMQDALGYCDDPLVSVDFKGDTHGGVVDALSTMVINGNMVKILAWYDNEWGFTSQAVRLTEMVAKSMKD